MTRTYDDLTTWPTTFQEKHENPFASYFFKAFLY